MAGCDPSTPAKYHCSLGNPRCSCGQEDLSQLQRQQRGSWQPINIPDSLRRPAPRSGGGWVKLRPGAHFHSAKTVPVSPKRHSCFLVICR